MAEVIIKKKLEETKKYAFDKKVLEREMAKGEPAVDLFYKKNEESMENMDLITLREGMSSWGEDIVTEDIDEKIYLVKVKDHMIPVTVYEKKDDKKKKPAILFVHGGGFIGGAVKVKGSQCRYLAQQADAVVVSPEYRLAPECPYPGPVDDVMGTLEWLEENAERLNVDREKITIAGESAGGTLVGNCCQRVEKDRIKMAFYIYGAVDVAAADETPYHWDYSLYKMDEDQKDYIMNRLYRFKSFTEDMERLYLQNGESALDGAVSPLYAEDFSDMPKSVMIEAEFDYFRICNEEYVKKLEAAGNDVEVIFYEGLDHGFFDRLGALPQAADCVDEIAKRIKAL